MIESIVQALALTLIPNSDNINEGTNRIAQFKNMQGYCIALMQIVNNQQISNDIRQAGLANLKLNIEKRWVQKKNNEKLLELMEKNIIRDNIFDAIIRCNKNPKLLPLYKEILKIIIKQDYLFWNPRANILNFLNQKDNIPSILHCIIAISSAFALGNQTSISYYNQFIDVISPLLLKIVEKQSDSQVTYLTLKCFWKFVNMNLNQTIVKHLLQWMNFIKLVIDHDHHNYSLIDLSKIKKYTTQFWFFHSKKWATRILHVFFQKHACYFFSKENEQFAHHWYKNYASQFIKSIIIQIKIDNIIKVKYFQLKIIESVVSNRIKFIQQYARELLFNLLIPFLTISSKDLILAAQDPVQYFRYQSDPFHHYQNVKFVATEIWIHLNSHTIDNKKNQIQSKYFDQSMQFIENKLICGILEEKQMVIYLLVKLRTIIFNTAKVRQKMPTLILKYILPLIDHSHMLIRVRVVQILEHYFDTYQNGNNTILKQILEKIYKILQNDPDNIVKLKAACTFSSLISNQQIIQTIQPPLLQNILTIYIELLSNYDSEEVADGLQKIIKTLGSRIDPFSINLIYKIQKLFMRCCKSISNLSNDASYDGRGEMLAQSYMRIIQKIVDSMSNQYLAKIQTLIKDIVIYCFLSDQVYYLDTSLEILNAFLSKFQFKESSELALLFPVFLYSIIGLPQNSKIDNLNQRQLYKHIIKKGAKPQFIQIMLPVIRNLIYKFKKFIPTATDNFGMNLVQMLFKVINYIYNMQQQMKQNGTKKEKCSATALLIYLLECLDNLENMMMVTWEIIKYNLNEVTDKLLMSLNTQLFCVALYKFREINFLQYIKQREQKYKFYIKKLFQEIQNLENKYNKSWIKKRIVLGISTLFNSNILNKFMDLYPHSIFKFLYRQLKFLDSVYNYKYSSDQDSNLQCLDDENDEFDDWSEKHDQYYNSPFQEIDQIKYTKLIINQLQNKDIKNYRKWFCTLETIEMSKLHSILTKQRNQEQQMSYESENEENNEINQLLNVINNIQQFSQK